MASPFDSYTRKDITKLLITPTGYAENRALYDGDHWGKDGCFWLGPRLGTTDAGASETLDKIKKALISKNAVAEIVGRHVAAILRHEPAWSLTVRRPLGQIEVEEEEDVLTADNRAVAAARAAAGLPEPPRKRTVKKMVDEQPNEAEQLLIDEAEALLTAWWDTRGAKAMLQDAVATLLLAGRAPLRLYVPSGLLENGQIPAGDLAESLGLIYADPPPDPTVATVAEDAKTRRPIGIYMAVDPDTKQQQTEITYLDGDETVLRILGVKNDLAEPFRFDFGGALPMHELRRSALVTPQVRQQQMLLNLALTMLGRNVVLGGFLERILLNAQLPGRMEQQSDGSTRFIPDPLQVGAGTTNVITGMEITDPATNEIKGYATPSVVYRDPVPTTTFVETKADAYRGILEEVQQLHALISGDATASGESRKQARADFVSSLSDTTTQIERAGRWLLETLLAMAAAFSGQPGRFAELRAVFECQIDVGPISSEDMGATRANVAAGLLSEQTGMAQIGVEDVDAEQARVASERDARAARAPQIVALPATQSGDLNPPAPAPGGQES